MTKLEELERDLDAIVDGVALDITTVDKVLGLLRKYAGGYGTGFNAYKKAKEEIERLIKEEKSRKPNLDDLKRRFRDAGYHEDGEAWDYVKALEKCLPWTIRNKNDGRFWTRGLQTPVVFLAPTKVDAESYYAAVTSPTNVWEVVQWEGPNE